MLITQFCCFPHVLTEPCRSFQGARHVGKDLAGMDAANPVAALLSTAMMLDHLKLHSFADRLEAAVLKVRHAMWGHRQS